MKERSIEYLKQCHNPVEGGFRGAPYIISHVASTYAAVMAIVNLSNEAAFEIVDLPGMKKYLTSVKNNFKRPEDNSLIHFSHYGFMSNEEF